MPSLTSAPIVKTEMLIRRPAADVFAAFADPAVTTRFWFTKSSGRLEPGKRLRWTWEMYGVGDDLTVLAMEQDRRILIEWSNGTTTEWIFQARADGSTHVVITNAGFAGSGDAMVAAAIDSMGGYCFVLSGLKALLEHGIELNLVADKAPDAHVKR